MTTPVRSESQPIPCQWLRDAILAGEPEAWSRIAACDGRGMEAPPALPPELVALAKASPEAPPAGGLAACSTALRLLCAVQPTATDSMVLATVCVLRLSVLDHDDPAWADLLPRWLVPSLAPADRGLGLLAMALHARDRLCAEDYADLMDEAIGLLPQDAPLRNAHIYQYALHLGLRGMLQRLAGIIELPRSGDQEPEVGPELLTEAFYDAVCCGRTAQAAFLERAFAATPEAAWQLGLFHMHRVHIPVFAAIANRTALPATGECPSLPLMHALLAEDPDLLDAFEADETSGEVSPLFGFDALRIALARRDHASARRILEQRALSPAKHWLDDLFLARLLLLEDRPREAGEAFIRLEASASRYGGAERVEIELRLATELSRHDCCRLGQLAGGAEAAPTDSRAAEFADEAMLAGESVAAAALRSRIAMFTDGGTSRILIVGPDDGSRDSLGRIMHARLGGGRLTRLGAAEFGVAGWTDAAERALDQHGLVVLDGLEHLDQDGQAWLWSRIEGRFPATLVAMAGPALADAVVQGRWHRELYWRLAGGGAIVIPGLGDRAADLSAMVGAIVRHGAGACRWEAPAVAALGEARFPGGWQDIRLFAGRLLERCPNGVVSATSLDAALASGSETKPPRRG